MNNQSRNNSEPTYTVGVFGAGAIGTYVGTLCSASGAKVVLLGRERLVRDRDVITAMTITGREIPLAPTAVVTTDPDALRPCDLVIVSVKSGDTPEAAKTLSSLLRPDALVISLQNGLHNQTRLRSSMPQLVSAGVVGFNVKPHAPCVYEQTVASPLVLEYGDPRLDWLASTLKQVSQNVRQHRRIGDVMAGKLLLNTNNGVCGATGLPILEMMRDVDARWCFSQCIHEGYRAMTALGLRPTGVGGLSPRAIGWLMRLPNGLFRPLLRFSRVREGADASTAQDLRRGRTTEIGELNGEVVALGERAGVLTPVNRVVTRQVQRLEREIQEGVEPSWISGSALRQAGERAIAGYIEGDVSEGDDSPTRSQPVAEVTDPP